MTDGHATFLLFTQASVMIMAHSKMLIFGFFRMSVRQSSRNVCTARPSVGTVKMHDLLLKVAFFQKVRFVFQISKSQKKNIPKNYPELEI